MTKRTSLALGAIAFTAASALACTNFIAGKKATADVIFYGTETYLCCCCLHQQGGVGLFTEYSSLYLLSL